MVQQGRKPKTGDGTKKIIWFQRLFYYRPFALLIRGAEHAEGFILFLFAERGEKK